MHSVSIIKLAAKSENCAYLGIEKQKRRKNES